MHASGRAHQALEVVAEVLRCMLLCMPEVMRCVVFYMPKAAEGGLCLLEVLDVLEEPEMIRCVLLCLMEVFDVLDVPEVMRSVLLCMLEVLEVL